LQLTHITMSYRTPTRFAYEGADPWDSKKIIKMGYSHINTSSMYIQDVATIGEYESGCNIHDQDCPGHICRTPSGLLLPPQYMALRTNIMRNEIYAAAEHAFAPQSAYHTEKYKEILTDMLKGKDGKTRNGVVVAPVDGSLRMAIIPQTFEDNDGNYTCHETGVTIKSKNAVFIPRYLKDKFKAIRINEETSRYESDYVKSNDRSVCLREPALDSGSLPLVRIFHWDKTAMGIHPALVKGLRGDYDGDEVHLYPVYSKESVKCADSWEVEDHPDFVKANRIYKEHYYPDRRAGSMAFMWHTTMSFKELIAGKEPPLMSEFNRMSKDHMRVFRERADPRVTAKSLVQGCMDGLASLNAQQHSQPIIGDKARIARLSMSSIKQPTDSSVCIQSRTTLTEPVQTTEDMSAGNAAVRSISRICAAGQQAMLSAHRVSKSNLPAHDIINDMIIGSENTVVFFSKNAGLILQSLAESSKDIVWCAEIADMWCVLCSPRFVTLPMGRMVKAAYNPIVLSNCPEKRRHRICKLGIELVFRQCRVPVSDAELDCLSVAYTYQLKIDDGSPPITSRDGISSRSLHWLDTMVATSYHQLQSMVAAEEILPIPVNTITSALASCNFDMIH
jgi:hypothetical protein